jgi:uncharacterized protein
MKIRLASFICGIVFALGLGISGMTRPSKVIGFLDIAGAWDLSLAFVMLGAIGIYFIAFRLIRKRRAPILTARFYLPARNDIDAQLILGAIIFGVGWGLSGFCPGPAITSLASGAAPVAVFVASMAVGIYLHAMMPDRVRSRGMKISAPAENLSAGAELVSDA